MRTDTANLDHARKVADAILYKGYLLYPYRRSAQKNRTRFQFGVLMPPAYRAVADSEPSASQTECLVECPGDAEVQVLARFLQLQRSTVHALAADGEPCEMDTLDVGGTEYTCFDEAVEREQSLRATVADLDSVDTSLVFRVDGGEEHEDLTDSGGRPAGRLARHRETLHGAILIRAERVAGPCAALRLRVRLENRTCPPLPLCCRDDSLRYAMIAVHALIRVAGGKFLSLTDPPEWAAGEAAACVNTGTWPVLAGPPDCRDLVLSSPVILHDHPEVAPESAEDLSDATEIDEIVTLRTLALTDSEEREARATDPRASALMDRLDDMPPEMLEPMHGAIRYLKSAPADGGLAEVPEFATPGAHAGTGSGLAPGGEATDRPPLPWWDPGSDASVSPASDHVIVDGVRVARGTLVRMCPGSRRADAQDLFLAGREALVQAVLHDVDGQVHIAVSPTYDPAADLQASHGRFLYFAPDEIKPIPGEGPAGRRLSRARPRPTIPAKGGKRHDFETDQGSAAGGSPCGHRPVAARHQAVPGTPRHVTRRGARLPHTSGGERCSRRSGPTR